MTAASLLRRVVVTLEAVDRALIRAATNEVNKLERRPVWRNDSFEPRAMFNLSSSFDHRVVDGWDAATFVQRIKSLLEMPALLFIDDES